MLFLLSCFIFITCNMSYAQKYDGKKVEKRIKNKYKTSTKQSMPVSYSKEKNVKSANLTKWNIDSSQTTVAIYQYELEKDAKKALQKYLQKAMKNPDLSNLQLGDEHFLFKSIIKNKGMLLIRQNEFLLQLNTNAIDTSIELAEIILKELRE